MPVRPGLALVAALLGSLTPALAAPTPMTEADFVEVRRTCAIEERKAMSHEPSEIAGCARRYLDYFNQDPSDPQHDETLYVAGVWFEKAQSVSAAIQAYSLLRKFFPVSKLSAKALAREAMLYARIVMYDKAAERLEQYAKMYAGEKDAYDAMSDAVYYRRALGDDDKAIENTKYFVRTYGVKKPREAANADFSITSIYEKRRDHDAVVKHLRGYIRIYGAKGGDDRLVIAHAKIGQSLWEQSCPVKQIDGLCVRVERPKRAAVATCGAATNGTLVTMKRDEKRVIEALTSFSAAVKQFEKVGGRTGGDDGGARYYYATAKLAVADRDFEAYASLTVPRALTFGSDDVDRKSQKRFAEWLEDGKKRGAKLLQHYEQVLAVKDPATSIAAAERIARVQDVFASALLTAELPAAMRTGPNKTQRAKAYCDELATLGEPLRAQTKVSYGVCLSKATELGWFDAPARSCERALGQLAPDDFPPLRERTADASNDALVIALEPAL